MNFLKMKTYNLQWYVDKLKKGEKFSLARYGDGEMYCMWGKQGQNSNGCRYSPELREALLGSMNHKNDPTFIYGMQRVLPQDKKRMEEQYPDIDWHDSEIFGEAVANGELFPFIEQLRKMEIVFISNASIWDGVHKIFDCRKFKHIVTPMANTFDDYTIIDKIREENYFYINSLKGKSNKVYLFSCGMAANAFIAELHGKVDGWLIDIGHIWDPFTGNMSRCDLEGKTMEDIEKNLHDR